MLVVIGGFYTYIQMTKPKHPTEEVVLVVKGKITGTNLGNEYHFDLAMLLFISPPCFYFRMISKESRN